MWVIFLIFPFPCDIPPYCLFAYFAEIMHLRLGVQKNKVRPCRLSLTFFLSVPRDCLLRATERIVQRAYHGWLWFHLDKSPLTGKSV